MTSKERAALRAQANSLEPLFQVGKGGVNDNFIAMIDDALEKNELLKVTVLENSGETPRDICHQVMEATNAEPVQVIGNKFIIYRRSVENPTIALPK